MTADPTKINVARQIARTDILFGLARRAGTAQLVVGSSDFHLYEIDLNDSADKPATTSLGQHESYVTSVALAGDWIVSGSYDCQLQWRRRGETEPARTVAAHEQRIRRVVASPDGKLLASVGDDMVCRLWKAGSGKLLHELRGHATTTPHHYPSMLYAAAFSPDGEWLATGDKAGQVIVWNVATGKAEKTLDAAGVYTWDPSARRHSIGGIRSLAFSPDGRQLAVGGMGKVRNIDHPDAPGRLEVFNWQSGERTAELETDGKLKGLIHQLAFHPGGDWLIGAGGGYAGFFAFFDLSANKILFQDAAPMRVHDLALGDDPATIYAVGHNKAIVWSLHEPLEG